MAPSTPSDAVAAGSEVAKTPARQTAAAPGIAPALPERAALRETAGGHLRPAPAAALWLLIVFLLLEYARPPVIAQFRIQLVLIALFPLIWLMASERHWSSTLTLQAAFFAACAATVPFASNYFSAYMQTRVLFGYLSLALAITWILATWRNFKLFLWLWIGVMAYQALYSLGHGGRGSGGLLGDENDLALGCATVFPFALLGLRSSSPRRRVVCGALTALFASAIVVSFSRGGFIALAATTLYCVWTGRHRSRKFALGLVGTLAFIALVPNRYTAELLTIQDTESGTAKDRQFLWAAAFNMWKEHPILGVGAGNSSFRVGEYQPRGDRWDRPEYRERNWSATALHSLYFQTLSELGLVGVILLAAVVVGHFRTLRQLRRRTNRDPTLSLACKAEVEFYCVGLAGAMVAYLAGGLFLSVLVYPYPWYFSAMAVAYSRALPEWLANQRNA